MAKLDEYAKCNYRLTKKLIYFFIIMAKASLATPPGRESGEFKIQNFGKAVLEITKSLAAVAMTHDPTLGDHEISLEKFNIPSEQGTTHARALAVKRVTVKSGNDKIIIDVGVENEDIMINRTPYEKVKIWMIKDKKSVELFSGEKSMVAKKTAGQIPPTWQWQINKEHSPDLAALIGFLAEEIIQKYHWAREMKSAAAAQVIETERARLLGLMGF